MKTKPKPPINVWCRCVDLERATCPNCGERVKERGAANNNHAIWSIGEYIRAKFRSHWHCCKACFPRIRKQCNGYDGRLLAATGYSLPDWIIFDEPLIEALEREKFYGMDFQDKRILADFLDDKGEAALADRLRVYLHERGRT